MTFDNKNLYGKTDRDSIYYAIDLSTGEVIWKKVISRGTFYDYTYDGVGKYYLYLSGDEPVIYIYNKKNAKYVGTIRLQSWARSITSKGNALFISEAWKPDSAKNAYGRIIRINKKTHQIQWQYTTKNGGFYGVGLLIQNGVVYSGTSSGHPGEFVALNAKTGKVKWKQEGVVSQSFTFGGDTLFVVSDQALVALDAKTGRKLWTHDFTYSGASNVAYLNGYVYHAHGQGLYIFNAETGQIAAGPIFAPDGGAFYNATAGNGRIFIETSTHLYCYKAYSGENSEP